MKVDTSRPIHNKTTVFVFCSEVGV